MILQSAVIDLDQLALLGVGSVVLIALLAILAQIGLSYLAQRNLNDQLSLGIQGVVGTNNLQAVDRNQEDEVVRERVVRDEVVPDDSEGGSGGT